MCSDLIFLRIFHYTPKAIPFFLSHTVGPFAGAGFGAWFGFYLGKSSSNKKALKENKSFLAKARYAIQKIYKVNKQFNDFIKEHSTYNESKEQDEINIYEIRRYLPNGMEFLPRIPVDELMFLLDYSQGNELLDAILLIDAQKNNLISILNERNNRFELYNEPIFNPSLVKPNPKKSANNVEYRSLSEKMIKTNKELDEDCKNALNKIASFIRSKAFK